MKKRRRPRPCGTGRGRMLPGQRTLPEALRELDREPLENRLMSVWLRTWR